MIMDENGRITNMANNFNREKQSITKQVGLVNILGDSSDMSELADRSTKIYLECINQADSLEDIPRICEQKMLEIKKEKSDIINQNNVNRASFDEFLDFE